MLVSSHHYLLLLYAALPPAFFVVVFSGILTLQSVNAIYGMIKVEVAKTKFFDQFWLINERTFACNEDDGD